MINNQVNQPQNSIDNHHIIPSHYTHVHLSSHRHPSLLIRVTKDTLYSPPDRSIFSEVLPNHALTRKRASDFLTDTPNCAVLGESATESAFGVEDGRAFGLVAGEGGGGGAALMGWGVSGVVGGC
jgi:hypothetical protein